jgi:hypothetical protein
MELPPSLRGVIPPLQAVEEGPDFINYRAKSAFEAAPRLGIEF